MSIKNPWEDFARRHQRNEIVTAPVIRRVDDLGLFVDLQEGLDGIVHLSDLDWETEGEEAILEYAEGDEVKAVILSINVELQRVSLGIKQLSPDPRRRPPKRPRRPPGDEPIPINQGPGGPLSPRPMSEAARLED